MVSLLPLLHAYVRFYYLVLERFCQPARVGGSLADESGPLGSPIPASERTPWGSMEEYLARGIGVPCRISA